MSVDLSLIVAEGKHNNEYYIVRNGETEEVAKWILKDRIDEGCYYFDEELDNAKEAFKSGRAWPFLLSRADAEYERVSYESFSNE